MSIICQPERPAARLKAHICVSVIHQPHCAGVCVHQFSLTKFIFDVKRNNTPAERRTRLCLGMTQFCFGFFCSEWTLHCQSVSLAVTLCRQRPSPRTDARRRNTKLSVRRAHWGVWTLDTYESKEQAKFTRNVFNCQPKKSQRTIILCELTVDVTRLKMHHIDKIIKYFFFTLIYSKLAVFK